MSQNVQRTVCPKIVCGDGAEKGGKYVRMGEERHGCWGIDAPDCIAVVYTLSSTDISCPVFPTSLRIVFLKSLTTVASIKPNCLTGRSASVNNS